MEPTKLKPAKKKILLMGKSGSGKSSMRSIIFSNFVAKDVRRLAATIDVEHAQFKFLGNLILNLWDCGGQDAFTQTYLTSQKPHVFSDVGVLIYVFDTESRHFHPSSGGSGPSPSPSSPSSSHHRLQDLETYTDITSALAQYSPSASIFCLIHKMDLVPAERRQSFIDAKEDLIIQSTTPPFDTSVTTFGTSIWDQTLYAAWGAIVQVLTPNLALMERYLKKLALATQAEEVILFERATFLKVISVTTDEGDRNPYPDRMEKISNFVKSFKHSLQAYTGHESASHPFGEFGISCPRFNLLLGRLTGNSYVLVVGPPGGTGLQNVRLNVAALRDGLAEVGVGMGERG